MTAWHEDEAFWEDTAPLVFNEERWRKASEEVEQIVSLLQLSPGAAVLDLCCGQGRHALEFARYGHHVTGVDRTAAYLDAARARAQRQHIEAEWVEADMRHFRRDNTFDVAVNLLTSFGYFEDPVEDRVVVKNVLASLKPGGRLVLDLMGKEVLARIFQPRDWHEEPDGTMLLEERTISGDWSWIDVRWIILRGDQRRERRFGHRLYSAADLKNLLANVGFVHIRAYGSLKGAAYDHQAERLVVVAEKPKGS
jgi:SAM-dependent methyltransferase